MARYAAIDIGSNSLRMQAAEMLPGEPMQILASDREVTRLGESVFRTGRISPAAIGSVCATLKRMADAYRKLNVLGVRAVATSAVRDASNQLEFLERASVTIGKPVEVISGQEEARLIHLGVQSRWPHPDKRILVVDVGGGSAEIILAENGKLAEATSKQLGAVRLREIFLKSDPPGKVELSRMEDFIQEKLGPVLRSLSGYNIDRAIATSATAAAAASALHRIPRDRRGGADRLRAPTVQMRKLYGKLSTRDLEGRRKITGIGPRRAEVIVPGVALLLHVAQTLRLPSFFYSVAGVRDGILADLAARGLGELSQLSPEQRRVIEDMARRYSVPLRHARKVAALSRSLFEALLPLHRLQPTYGKLLEAAAYLHDIGHFVSDTRHHKHSYYLVANSDMPGFTDRERGLIANLCRYHRKAMPTPLHPGYQSLTPDERRAVTLLFPILRIADSLDSAQEQRVERVGCRVSSGKVILQLSASSDIGLEQWAAERAAEIFRSVYEKPLVLQTEIAA